MPFWGPPDIIKLEEKGNVKGLVKALNYPKDNSIRAAAAIVLGDIGDNTATPSLQTALNDEDFYVRIAAAQALGQIGDTRAASALIDALNDPDNRMRKAALEAIGELGTAEGIPSLVALLGDQRNIDLFTQVVNALDNCGWEPEPGEAGIIYWMVKGEVEKCMGLGSEVVETLCRLLQHEDENLRRNIVESLGVIGDHRAIEPLKILLLKEKIMDINILVVSTLEKMGWKPEKPGWQPKRTPESVYYLIKNRDIVASIIDILLSIGKKEGYVSTLGNGKFDKDGRHKKVRQLGLQLFNIGGVGLMQEVWDILALKGRGYPAASGSALDRAWSYIGDKENFWMS
jgi:hypothetical protein